MFCGFQKQQNVQNTVQEVLESALFYLTQEKVGVVCAGRTDTGVHALAQIVHVDLSKQWSTFQLCRGLNFYLKNIDIAVIRVYACDLHARFDAKERFYTYHILNRSAPSPLLKNRAWHIPQTLDIDLMQKGCEALIGHHNFNAFRSSACEAKNAQRTLNHAQCERVSSDQIHLRFSAQAFLHNQVRIMVGTLVYIGLGKIPVSQIQQAFNSGMRQHTGKTAPPYGLYFSGARYT